MAYDNSTAKTFYGSSDTMSHTVGSGSGRYLVVFIYLQTDTDKVTAVSYAGTAMTRLLRVNSGGGSAVYAYGLANPTSGANNVSITLTDASLCSYAAISADSIAAATPVVAGTCSAFMSSPSSQSATATGAGIAFGYHATGADTANQFTVSGSTRGEQNLNTNLQATAYQTVSGAGSVSMTETWTGGNSKNGVKMVVLLEATGGGDTTAPTITGPGGATGSTSSISVSENTTTIHTFTANESVTWSLNGGADVALFSINSSTGALTFTSGRDYETPTDSDANNTYVVGVRATDAASNATTQTVTVTVTDVVEGGGSQLLPKLMQMLN